MNEHSSSGLDLPSGPDLGPDLDADLGTGAGLHAPQLYLESDRAVCTFADEDALEAFLDTGDLSTATVTPVAGAPAFATPEPLL